MKHVLPLAALVLAAAISSPAQNPIKTVAGGAMPNNLAPTAAGIEGPYGVVRDAGGNLFVFADNGIIYKVTPGTVAPSTLTIYSGSINAGYSGDGGPASKALLNEPFMGALDAAGNLYFSDASNCLVREINASTQIISTIAGNGACAYTGDGGKATAATLNNPQGIAFDGAGNLYIVDCLNNAIRKVDTNGNISTYVGDGTGNTGYNDNVPANQATLNNPEAIASDANGNLYIADTYNNAIRYVNATTTLVTSIVGNGTYGNTGDGGPANQALLRHPQGVLVDGNLNLYIADTESAKVRYVAKSTNIINTLIGSGVYGFGGDGGPALSASFSNVFQMAIDGIGDVWVTDYWNDRIRFYNNNSDSSGYQTVTTVVGNGSVYDGGPATSASLYFPRSPKLDAAGNLYITDTFNNRIREVDSSGNISTFAGNGIPCDFPQDVCGDGGAATGASFYIPRSVAFDNSGNMIVFDTYDNRVRKIAGGIVTTIAGTGDADFTGDGGAATAATFNKPWAGGVDAAGNLYVLDAFNNRVRKIDTSGNISTVAGSGATGCGNGGFSGDGGPATSALLNCPIGLDVDAAGDLFISDYYNFVIRRVDAKTQVITTVVGTPGVSGYTGDGGPATSATLSYADRVSVNAAGNLFISDAGNNVIRRVDALTGKIETFAGNGTYAFAGDGGPALSASFATPTGVVVTNSGDLYVGDLSNNRIREITLTAGATLAPTTVAFGNEPQGSTSATQTVTLTDTGDAPLTISDVAITGDFAIGTNNCGTALTTGASCTILLTFTPTAVGARTGTLTVTDNGPTTGSTQTAALTGTGVAAASGVTLNPTSLTFTSQNVGTSSAAQSVTLTNNGNAALAITGLTVTGAGAADFSETNTCPASLAVEANCAIAVTFKPTAAGARAASISIADNAVGSPQTIQLTGTGASTTPTLTVTPSTLTFPSQTVQTTSSPLSVTVANTGTATVQFTSFTIAGTNGADYKLGTGTCTPTGTLAAGASCTIAVTFTPAAAGARTGTLTVADNATGSPQSIALSGTGASAASAITVTPASLTFPSQAVQTTSAPLTVTVSNTGTSAAQFSSFSITGANSGDYALGAGTCSATGTLAVGANCTIAVTFTPAAAGTRTATLSIADNATGSPQLVALTGAATTSAVTVTIPSGGSTTATSVPGGTAYFGLVIISAPGVTGTVTLGCTPSSPLLTCSVVPSTVTLNGGKTEVAFGVQTYCQGTTSNGFVFGDRGGPVHRVGPMLFAFFSLLIGVGLWSARRDHRLAIAFAMVLLIVLGSAACGGGLAKGPNGATPAGTYSLTLTTTFNGQTQTLPNYLTLIVN